MKIKIVDGIPCIVTDVFGPSRPIGPRMFFVDFTRIQEKKEMEFFEDVIEELKKIFSE